MDRVTVNRDQLRDKLIANRDEHRAVFLAAQTNFRDAVITRLDAMLADARDGKRVSQHVGLIAPVDHTRDYDCAIAMLEMSVNETIQITAQEFTAYVLDQWQWARQFGATAMSYGISNKYSVDDANE